jgi:hypothetical protein
MGLCRKVASLWQNWRNGLPSTKKIPFWQNEFLKENSMSDKKDVAEDKANRLPERMAPVPSEEKRFVIMERREPCTDMLVMHQSALVELVAQLEEEGESKAAQVVSDLLRRGRAFMAEPESYTVDYQCLKCKKYRDQHRADHCPIPSSSRTFLHYSSTEVYEPNPKKPRKVPFLL